MHAILEQASFGPSDPLGSETFAFLLETLDEELAPTLDRATGSLYGGRRYLCQHVWAIAGDDGARWLRTLALADDIRANALYQDMASGRIAPWRAEDWPARLDALASLPADPRPGIVNVLFLIDPPPAASPALVRLALAHGADERDPLVRYVADRLRALRGTDPEADLELFDWSGPAERCDLLRWILELSGEPGDRAPLVARAARSELVTDEDAAMLGAPVERPAWADREVPWEIDRLADIGTVPLPSGTLTGGDPWWTGRSEGFPWTVEVGTTTVSVQVVVAHHPLAGRQCAALLAKVREGAVVRWKLIEGRVYTGGYHVEVGVASFGSVEWYDGVEIDNAVDDSRLHDPPAWLLNEDRDLGGSAMCTVGPQHQLCRTWLGTAADGAVLQLVTDLGLLDLDLGAEPALPW